MAGMGNYKHLETDSPKPPSPAKDVLRIYGMKFCPFVQRTKLVLSAKCIKHETVNINLKKRPSWFKTINPSNAVPCLEFNGNFLHESNIIASYIDEAFSGRKLTTSDPLKKAQELLIVKYNEEVVSGLFLFVVNKDEEQKEKGVEKIRNAYTKITRFLKERYPFIGGDKPGITDYVLWPHLERTELLIPNLIEENSVLNAYIERMEKDEAVIYCRQPKELHLQYFKGAQEKKGVFDIGTVEEYKFN